jgi:hypothetical protein
LKQLLADKLGDMPAPEVEPRAWQNLWSLHRDEWAALIKLALQRAAEHPWRAGAALAGTGLTRWSCRAVGEDAEGGDEFMCAECGKCLPSVQACTMHRIRNHGADEQMQKAKRACICRAIVRCDLQGAQQKTSHVEYIEMPKARTP